MKTLSQRLPHLPVTAFAMVMGLTGLAIAFGKFYHLQWLPKVPFDIALFLGLGVFVLLSVLYAAKFAMFPGEVAAEFNHPVRTNFFATISISLLLLSIGFHAYWPVLAVSFWWAGTILQTVLALRTMTFWVQHNYEIRHCSPAWFIPVVGNILVPVAGVDFAPKILCYFYFAFGMFFWIALFAIVLYRNMRLTASWDPTAIFLLFVAYVFVALLVFMQASFRSLRFYLSWWAFTFPLAAATIASAVAFQITLEPAYKVFAFLLLVATAGVIAVVAFLTGLHACRGEICVPED